MQRVVATPMRVTGTTRQLFELSEHGGINLGSKDRLQLGQGSDLVPFEEASDVVGMEAFGPHYRRIVPQ